MANDDYDNAITDREALIRYAGQECYECDRLQVTEDLMFCPLHAAAPEMAEALAGLLGTVNHLNAHLPTESDALCPICFARAALQKAGIS
jgi:RNA polymerase subunit RPABC4/transcription elongation factor Spt4